VLRDAENHHGRGVHDADKDSGEPDCRIGGVSLAIGKAPGTPGSLRSATGLSHPAWAFVGPAARWITARLGAAVRHGAESLSVEADHSR
jgi:hypothetical protein